MEDFLNKARSQLASRGFKWTGPREEILTFIGTNADGHLSAEQVYKILQDQGSDIGLATVYRTLDLLVETGLVHRLNFGDGCTRYELADGSHLHHHLICSSCGRVQEVAIDLLELLEQHVHQLYDFEISDHHLKFYGVCANCKNVKKKGEAQ